MIVGSKPKAWNDQRLLRTSQLRSLFSSGTLSVKNDVGQRNAVGPPSSFFSVVCVCVGGQMGISPQLFPMPL